MTTNMSIISILVIEVDSPKGIELLVKMSENVGLFVHTGEFRIFPGPERHRDTSLDSVRDWSPDAYEHVLKKAGGSIKIICMPLGSL